ncbi:pyocin knob domain-containing S74 family peptidase [Achromobacter xylosoxidans]|uniref:pyocin knob domain-containing S74 family peptidase n=1 Tax=Alcaligenes xylosoxydans xylosoxydans TaxID=85698 RepID=UPI001EED28BB|nr:pyocin knob domain-containing S74 family peptidase [Achromobacter xylosoxidans]
MTAIKQINIGAAPNDQTGDQLRSAFDKVNANIAELDRRTVANATAAAIAELKAADAGKAADVADGKAVAAQRTGDTADAAARQARQAADEADAKALHAQASADSAGAAASQAQRSAQAAADAADRAQGTADAALPRSDKGKPEGVAPLGADGAVPDEYRPKRKCVVVQGNVDLNEYKRPVEVFLSSSAGVSNLPAGLNAPAFLLVEAAGDAAVQTLSSREASPRLYFRTFQSQNAWTPWREAGTVQDITGTGVDFNSMKSSGVFLWRTAYTLENGANYPKLQALRQCGEVSVLDLSGVVMQRLRYGALKADASGPEFSRQFVPAGDGTATGGWTRWRYVGAISDAADLATEDCGDVWFEGAGWRRWSQAQGGYVRFSPPVGHVWQDRSTQDYANGPLIRSLIDENCHFTVAGNNGKGAIFRATPYADPNSPTMIMACGTGVATLGTTKNGWGGPMPVRFITDDIERGRIIGSRWVFGPDLLTPPPYTHIATINYLGANYEYGLIFKPRNAGTTVAVGFMNSANSLVGSIQVTDSITQYNTASDYRLKHDVAATPIAESYSRVMGVRVVDYSMADAGIRYRGAIAHELQALIPHAVTGTKDEMIKMPGMEESVPAYQQVDYSKIVPDLIAALQHADMRINALEERVKALTKMEA